MQNVIEKTIDLKAPVARVWQALTDSDEFGTWFKVKLEGPFVLGEMSYGQMTYPGYEHVRWEAEVVAMDHERLFAIKGCPYGGEPNVDYSNEPHTVAEFRLESIASGTRLVIRESGFAGLPEERRADCFRQNAEGWDIQAGNIRSYVES
jgi:uncharacterized protein YndB with AHSA1/START domain